MNPERLADLVRRAQGGEEAAMEQVLSLLRPELEQWARECFSPGGAADSSADLVQESALRIWQKLGQFRGGDDDESVAATLRAWAAQIVRHLAQDRQRAGHAQRRRPSQPLVRFHGADKDSSESGDPGPAADQLTPSANAGSEETAIRVRAALEKIAEETDREIVRLCFFEGLSLRQIAERLHMSYDKVRQRYHHSLRTLERELGGLL